MNNENLQSNQNPSLPTALAHEQRPLSSQPTQPLGKDSSVPILQKPKKRSKKILIVFIVIVSSLYLFRANLVLDAKTGLPILGATVTYQHANWANGCGKEKSSTSGFLGFTFFPQATPLNYWGICSLDVSAPGYHSKGINNMRFGRLPLPIRITLLNKQKITRDGFQTELLKFSHLFYEKDGMDILSYIHDVDENISPEQVFGNKENDFIFSKLNSTERTAIVDFTGEGGVQEIGKENAINQLGQKYYNLENLQEAPLNGYSKRLELVSGKAYVARMRDGKHYMKFTGFATTSGKDYFCLNIFLNKNEGRNLDFLDIGKVNSCTRTINPGTYDTKILYTSLKQNMTGEKEVIKAYGSVIEIEGGYKIYLRAVAPYMGFEGLAQKSPDYDIVGKKVHVEMLPFKDFVSQYPGQVYDNTPAIVSYNGVTLDKWFPQTRYQHGCPACQ